MDIATGVPNVKRLNLLDLWGFSFVANLTKPRKPGTMMTKKMEQNRQNDYRSS